MAPDDQAGATPADSAPAPKLGLTTILAFSAPNASVAALVLAIAVYLPRFFATHVGFGLVAVGAAFTTVRLIDIAFDPIAGMVMDRTRTPLGRYRGWMIVGAPILMISAYMLFMAQKGISASYLIGWLLALYVSYSILTLSQASWAAVLAPKYDDRSRVFGWWSVLGVLGASAVLLLPIAVGRAAGDGGVAAMGWFLIISAPIGVALAVLIAPERAVRNVGEERFSLREYWEMISRPDMARIIVSDFCLAMGPGWMSAMYLYFFHDSRGFSIPIANVLLLVYIAAGFVGAPILSAIARRVGKHVALMGAAVGYSLLLVSLALLPRGAFWPASVLMLVLGACAVGFTMLIRAMVADVGDAVRLQHGKQRLGLLYAMVTSTQKIASALSIGVSFTVLAAMGYNAGEGAVNTPEAIRGLEIVYQVGPIVFVMLGGLCFIGYGMNAKRHAAIRAELDARDRLVGAADPVVVADVVVGVAKLARPAPASR